MTSPKEQKPAEDYNWRQDFRRFLYMMLHFNPLWPVVVIALLAAVAMPTLYRSMTSPAQTVVVYASQDQVYAEPILKEFEKETGIRVRAVFDSEAVKTVGLANRLLAERAHPHCDLFWNNEELRTRQLAAQNVFRETNGWTAIGYRSRRIVINTNKLSLAEAPRTLLELTNITWRGRIALAYPLFGTTATHFLALRQHWGETNWLTWCNGLAANKPFLVDGNSVVVKFVTRGEAVIGLTDSDDIAAEQREGAPIIGLPLATESLLIPNTIGLIRNAPHPESGQRLSEFLQRTEIMLRLVEVKALEGISAVEITTPTIQPDWDNLLRDLAPGTAALQKAFRR